MIPSVDPKKMAKVQQTSSRINAEVRILYKENGINIKLIPTTLESTSFVKNFVPKFAETITSQLSAFFGIKGEIIDVGKDKPAKPVDTAK